MARVGKYQALGRSLGQYKKTLYDVGSTEYAKQARAAEGQFERGMYQSVGTAIANIAGIVSERRKLKEMEKLGEQAKDLSGVGQREVDYQPMGKFGKAIGLDSRKKTEYFARDTGQVLSEQALRGIGKAESLGIGTKYSQYELVDPKIAEGTAPAPTRPDTRNMSSYGPEQIDPFEQIISPLDKNEQMDMFGKVLPKDESMMDSGIENTEQAYQRSLMEGDMLLTELPSEQSFLQMKEEMKENWWKGKEETPVEQTQMDTPKIKTEPQRGISEASYPVEQDIGTPLSGAMSDIAVRDNVKLREMGIVPATDWTKEGPITSPRTTLPSDRTFVSVEDIFMDTMRQDDNNMFDGMNQLVENQGFSKFEQEIAMSENPEYFKGDESKATYMDIDTKTGKNRPAEGYGVARGKQPKTRAQHNQALKSHIHESKKSARKTVGNKIWNKLPTEKQEVLTELIYQMGPNRIQEFPRFLGAMVRGNYELAAQELLYTKEGKPSDWSQKGGKARVRRIVKKLDPLIKFEDEKLPIYAMGEQ